MAGNDMAHQPDKAKKDGPDPKKQQDGINEQKTAWFGTNAAEFIEWADRVTHGFTDVSPATFEAIKAAYDALPQSERSAINQQAAKENRDLVAMLQAPVFSAFNSKREGRQSADDGRGSPTD